MTFGVTPTGFRQKSINDILSDVEARERAVIDPEINTGAEGLLGQLNATFADALASAWEVITAVYRSQYPDSATDEALDGVSAITGATRLPATKSSLLVTCAGFSGTVLLAGRIVSYQGDRFVSLEDATIPPAGQIDVPFESEEFGPVVALAGPLTIETPVSGWSVAIAGEDADLGRLLETDAELRLRRQSLLRAQGSATIEAILADLRTVENVRQAFVYENVSFITDPVTGRPPRSFECVVLYDDSVLTDRAVAQQIFDTKAAGTYSYGHPGQKVTETITDSQGVDHVIEFTRPDEIEIYIEVDIQVTGEYAGDDAVKLALATLGDALGVGETVVSERFQAEVFAVSGIFDLTDFRIDTVTPPTSTGNIAIDFREIAVFDTSRIVVNSTPVVT